MKYLNYALAITTLMVTASSAKALTTDTLADLVANNGSLSIGDKTFSNFAYLDSFLTGFNANTIQVTASVSAGIYYLTWGGNMALTFNGPATADLQLAYTVTATAPNKILMIDQAFTGGGSANRGSFITIDEAVHSGNQFVANSHLEFGDGVADLSDPVTEVGDDLWLTPGYQTLNVITDIGLDISDPKGGSVFVALVQQSFHQTAVPETGTTVAAMVFSGLMGLAGFRRKQRA